MTTALSGRFSPRQLAVLVSLAAFLILLPEWLVAVGWYEDLLLSGQRAEVLDTVSARSVALSSAINRRLARLQGLSAFVETVGDNETEAAVLDPFVSTLLEGSSGVRYLTVAPAGVVRYVYPSDIDEVPLGSLAVAATGVPGSQSSRLVELTHPQAQDSGEIGLLAWQSVQRDGLPWGQVSMAVDVQTLLAESGIEAAGDPLALALRDDRERVFFGDDSVFDAEPAVATVFLPDGHWSLAGAPVAGWSASVARPLRVFQVATLLVVLLLVALTYTVTARQGRLSQAVVERTEALMEAQQAREVAALTERQRLARELHDSVSQAFYAISLGTKTARTLLERDPAQVAEPLDYIETLAEGGLAETRSLIFALRPESLEQEGLVAALGRHVAAVKARYGLEIVTELGQEPPVNLEIKEALFRIAQEALTNVVKHAQASQVHISLSQGVESLTLEVVDDGRGFDATASFPGHLGLRSMKERCAQLNGRCRFDSTPGQGTRLRIEVPVLGGVDSTA